MTPNRRQASLGLLAAAALPIASRSQGRLSGSPFRLGVASGSPSSDGIVLWTRLVQDGLFGLSALDTGPVTVRWELAQDEAFARIVQGGQVQALPELAHSVHVEVAGLDADRAWFYRFLAGDAVSTTGRTRTLPAPDAAVTRLRLAYASCQRWEHGYFTAWRHLVADQPDLVVFLGDYIYEYPTSANPVRTPGGGWVLTLADYRQRHALYRSDADLQAAHAACPWLVTWDDHEVQNDYAGLTAGENGPAVADFGARRAAAYQAYYEHMPLRASVLTRALAGLASGAEMRIHGQWRWGRLASLTLLDMRQYRSPQVCTKDGQPGSSQVDPARCASWADPARSLLGAEQERWLAETLGRSAASGWNVVGQSTLVGLRDFKPGPGQSLWNDGWDGYGAARGRLVDSLRRASNPVLLGGDVHENWVGHVLADAGDAGSAPVATEFCGTSITARTTGAAKTAERLAENPHFVFADAQRKGYGLAEFSPERMQVTLRVVDNVEARNTRVETLAAFSVASGKPRIERV
jgi:alkaline phosphatase D